MRELLARHDFLIEDAVGRYDGVVVRPRGEGDSRFAVFFRATDALAGAAAIQAAIFAEPWPSDALIKVRMALHTGEAQARDGDYYGSAVNRCARLRSIAHGGQAVLSNATFELVRDAVPAGVMLRDLGSHRLKDLIRPERVYQIDVPGLPTKFPALQSLDTLPNNLPLQVTSFIGREKEMFEARQLLQQYRLLTFTGSGGTGKTRLAMQLAAEVLEHYPDGVWIAALAPITDPALVPQALAAALGLREESGRQLMATVLEHLRSRTVLLVLDNCEHLIATCSTLADTLLRSCGNLRLIASSREALRIDGEVVMRVPSLSLPDPQNLTSIAALEQFDAVKLFIARAVAVRPNFTVNNDNAPFVAQICHQLDGIPLAIELAAARAKAMSVEQIANRLDDCFRLLAGGSRAALPRQQTLMASIAWSYDLLDERERAMWRRLTVFAGGWTTEAAEHVCAGVGPTAQQTAGDNDKGAPSAVEIQTADAIDLITLLVDKSLVMSVEIGDRYLMLETIRRFGQSRISDAEKQLYGMRHRDWFVAFAEQAEPHLTQADNLQWFNRLEADHDNLRTAFEWSVARRESEFALRFVGALWRFWEIRGHFTSARQRIESALSDPTAASTAPSLRIKALHAAAVFASRQRDARAAEAFFTQAMDLAQDERDNLSVAVSLSGLAGLARRRGEYAKAMSLCEQSMVIYQQARDQRGIAKILNNMGQILIHIGDYGGSRRHFDESLKIRRKLGDEQAVAVSLSTLGSWCSEQKEFAAARQFLDQAISLFDKLGDRRGLSVSFNNKARVAQAQMEWNCVEELAEKSLAIQRDLGDKRGVAISLELLGEFAAAQRDFPKAASLIKQSLLIGRDLDDRRWVCMYLEALAAVEVSGRRLERAACLYGAGDALRQFIGAVISPRDREPLTEAIGGVKMALGEAAFAAAWNKGTKMEMDGVISFAIEDSAS